MVEGFRDSHRGSGPGCGACVGARGDPHLFQPEFVTGARVLRRFRRSRQTPLEISSSSRRCFSYSWSRGYHDHHLRLSFILCSIIYTTLFRGLHTLIFNKRRVSGPLSKSDMSFGHSSGRYCRGSLFLSLVFSLP